MHVMCTHNVHIVRHRMYVMCTYNVHYVTYYVYIMYILRAQCEGWNRSRDRGTEGNCNNMHFFQCIICTHNVLLYLHNVCIMCAHNGPYYMHNMFILCTICTPTQYVHIMYSHIAFTLRTYYAHIVKKYTL